MSRFFNKSFRDDWQKASPEDKRKVIKMIIILAGLTLIPIICISCSMATGAMWVNE